LREEWFSISFTISNYIGRITLLDSEGNNFITTRLLREFKNALKICHHSNEVKVIVLSGNGNCFSRGVDPEELSTYDAAELSEFSEFGWKVFNKLNEIKKPVIAEVNGDAFDAGFELMLLADLAFSSENAKFGFPGLRNGIAPSFGGISNLLDMVGIRIAKDLIFRGKIITSDRALELGLVNEVFKRDELNNEVNLICEEIINNNLTMLEDIKESTGKILDLIRRVRFDMEKNIFSH
jgi:enoyl-CoA hydratase/carnithine racemase